MNSSNKDLTIFESFVTTNCFIHSVRIVVTIMLLTDNEIIGLYVLFAIHFLPVVLVFLSARTRYATYKCNRPTVEPHSQTHLGAHEKNLLHFTIQDRRKYDAYCMKNRTIIPILPYSIYLMYLVVTAGVETAGMFLVWYDQASYSSGIYQASMGLQFAIMFFKVVWTFMFFDVPQYSYAAWSAGFLAALTFTNGVIILQDNTDAIANWFTYGWVAIFYFYSFLLSLVFCHTETRNRYHRVDGSYSAYDLADALFGNHNDRIRTSEARADGFAPTDTPGRHHGWSLDAANQREFSGARE